MIIKRTCKTCFHKTNGLCTSNYKDHKCDLYEIDYYYFKRLYTKASEQAPGELKQEFFEHHSISVYEFIERALNNELYR